MPLFWKPYTSDVTSLIEQMRKDRPTLPAEQRAGRALLWERQTDRETQAEFGEARVPQQPYVYQNKVG